MLLLKDEAAPSTQSPTEPAEPSGATNEQPEVSTAANNYRAALLRWSEVAHPYETSRERHGRIRGELQERMHRAGLTGPIDDHAVTVEMRREDALRAERSREERERHRELREVQERRRELCQQTSGPEHGMRDYREALLSTIMHRPLPEAWRDGQWAMQSLTQTQTLTLDEFEQMYSPVQQ